MRSDIPSNDAVMLPILRSLEDGLEHPLPETYSSVAKLLELDDVALSLRTPADRSLLEARAGWARWDLNKAGLVTFPRRGQTRITERGLEALEQNPSGIDRSYLRQFPEYEQYHRGPTRADQTADDASIDDAGIPLSDEDTKRNVWVEKTIVQGRPTRISGSHALGKALWSPLRDKANKDIYRFMRDVRPGDVILHLTDNRGFTGTSIATTSAVETVEIEDTNWEGPGYLIKLDNFEVLKPILPREIFFSEPFRTQLTGLLKSGLKNAFYNEGGLLNQGAYLTPASPEMLAILNDAYRSIAGKPMLNLGAISETQAVASRAEFTFEDLERATYWTREQLNDVIRSVSGEGGQRQIVLAGPPGTGKTYVARQLVRYLTQDDLDRYRIVQFHQSYTYEQFMEGLRPVVKAGGVEFAIVSGAVLELAEVARRSPLPHYLIIDEMNRANIQRVFGELMYLLEYRDQSISLAYTRDFALPDNLYFIGTMNTADRSIRNIDLALRRRFEVFDCEPSARILRAYYGTGGSGKSDVPDLLQGFERLNDVLSTRLDSYHTIGHSFFMSEHLTSSVLRNTWKRRLKPLLEELFFDEPEKLEGLTLAELWPSVDFV